MFTGLVEDLGTVTEVVRDGDGARLVVQTELAGQLAAGDSIAVNGVCLTATGLSDRGFAAEAMNETLARSSLGTLSAGSPVNLELPMRIGERLDGHIVQGHVDGLGTVHEVREDGFARRVRIAAPPDLLRYIVMKGSIAVDGISLTVADLDDASFTVSLIPETVARTTLGRAQPGTTVNLEVDVLAKYVERLMTVSG